MKHRKVGSGRHVGATVNVPLPTTYAQPDRAAARCNAQFGHTGITCQAIGPHDVHHDGGFKWTNPRRPRHRRD